MFKKLLLSLSAISFIGFTSVAQSVFAPLNQDYYHLIDRYEIKRGKFAEGFHTTVKPYTRKGIVQLADSVLADKSCRLSSQDFFNLEYLRNDSWEWTSDQSGDSDTNLWDIFYRKKADAYSSNTNDFDIHVNPVLNLEIGAADGGLQKTVSLNSRGVEIRGMINKKIGFYTFMTDNVGLIPDYVKNYVDFYNQNSVRLERLPGMPGEGYTKEFKTDPYGVDFFSARAYITFQATKNIGIQFGHDRNFIGNGFRSMILSDNAPPYLFLKITTQVGRFQYQNLFAELINPSLAAVAEALPKKYIAMHHLSMNLSRRFNLGIFEAVVFDKGEKGFDLNYLNPVIFYRYLEGFQGSSDNAFVGFDFKYNFKKHFSLYGQWMIDEFVAKEFLAGKGSWLNKYSVQAGLNISTHSVLIILTYRVNLILPDRSHTVIMIHLLTHITVRRLPIRLVQTFLNGVIFSDFNRVQNYSLLQNISGQNLEKIAIAQKTGEVIF
ncbi:hypothetical protein ACFFJX_25000 [Pseudarcicella hirudinis]|uniref:hypothetical protein n=1 Tax=Pseudarcicella hirudinis TaxID=1079859 RepID=UPI0035E5E4BE